MIPLASSDSENSCDRVRAVHDYVQWILTDAEAALDAQAISWAIIPDMIARHALAIVDNMTCTGRSQLPLQTLCCDRTTVMS